MTCDSRAVLRVGAASEICAEVPLPPERIMLTATHPHCGPAHLASPGHRDLVDQLANGVARSIRQALADRRPAQLVTGAVPVPGISGNRRDPAGPLDETAQAAGCSTHAPGTVERLTEATIDVLRTASVHRKLE